MHRFFNLVRIALVSALVLSIGGLGSCSFLALLACAQPNDHSGSGGGCCCGESCPCGPSCASGGEPVRDHDQAPVPEPNLRDLAKISCSLVWIVPVDELQRQLPGEALLPLVEMADSGTLFAKHTCLRV
jgi:hypothetical protein